MKRVSPSCSARPRRAHTSAGAGGENATEAPAQSAQSSLLPRPCKWCRGSTCSMRSACVHSHAATRLVVCARRLVWLSTTPLGLPGLGVGVGLGLGIGSGSGSGETPLGLPVVPLVNMIKAGSSSSPPSAAAAPPPPPPPSSPPSPPVGSTDGDAGGCDGGGAAAGAGEGGASSTRKNARPSRSAIGWARAARVSLAAITW
eukprot:scaffold101144_cov63-Phaeocystis_antarctica.AAC.3